MVSCLNNLVDVVSMTAPSLASTSLRRSVPKMARSLCHKPTGKHFCGHSFEWCLGSSDTITSASTPPNPVCCFARNMQTESEQTFRLLCYCLYVLRSITLYSVIFYMRIMYVNSTPFYGILQILDKTKKLLICWYSLLAWTPFPARYWAIADPCVWPPGGRCGRPLARCPIRQQLCELFARSGTRRLRAVQAEDVAGIGGRLNLRQYVRRLWGQRMPNKCRHRTTTFK